MKDAGFGRIDAAPPWIFWALTCYALTGSVGTLLGWGLGIPRLTDWDGNGISQMPNNALAMASAAASLLLLARHLRPASLLLGAFAGLVAAATLFEHVTQIDVGIDQLLHRPAWGQLGAVKAGRMGPPASVALTLIGLSVVLLHFHRTRHWAALGAVLTIAIASLSIVGYLFGADRLYALPRLTAIALQTATMLLALGVALLITLFPPRRTAWLHESATALLVRRGLPCVIVLPLGLGWLAARGLEARLYDPAFGAALLVLTQIALLTALLLVAASALRKREAASREAREQLQGVVGSISDAFVTLDAQWRLVFVNPAAEARLGKSQHEVAGRILWEIFPDAVGNEAHRQLQLAMSERICVEYQVYYPPWERWYSERAYPTSNGGLALLSRDITERVKAEQDLLALTAQLRDADRRKDEFLVTLAHELRNPLAPMPLESSSNAISLRSTRKPGDRRHQRATCQFAQASTP